ncbi:type II secretion system protein [Pseudaquabacterium terrae]|uniref:type II secretion system protein n=1 Tax=Pseudaquabacterium terrae TaxID=2732868 RepID=UPI0031B5CE22
MSGHATTDRRRGRRGFTLIELLVVLAILATLLSVAAPRYFAAVERARETALQANLKLLREAIDKHRADTGRLPETLHSLVERRYLRQVPVDPTNDSAGAGAWQLLPHPDGSTPGVYDVRSASTGIGRDGTALDTW